LSPRSIAVEIADQAYVLDDGNIVYEGTAADFGSDEKRVRALAGASAAQWTLAECLLYLEVGEWQIVRFDYDELSGYLNGVIAGRT